jgi:hypothetical protein
MGEQLRRPYLPPQRQLLLYVRLKKVKKEMIFPAAMVCAGSAL